MGRTRKYETPEQMQEGIDRWIEDRRAQEKPLTVASLCLALGFHSRQSLIDYEGYSEDFLDTIKTAKMHVQDELETLAIRGGNAAGCIFNLKNNFGYTDKQEIETSGEQMNKLIIETSDGKSLFSAYHDTED